MYDVAIIGGGPSGMSSALYALRAGLKPIIIERGLLGGQINNTGMVENYLGVGNVTGQELSESMSQQIEDNDIEVINIDIKDIERLEDYSFLIKGRKKEIHTKTVVLATGVNHKELGITGEIENQGRGISSCSTCDGYFFKSKHVAVIGGGDSAFEEGEFLSNIAKTVTLIYRKNKSDIKAKKSLQERFFDKPNTKIIENAHAFEFHDDGSKLKAVSYEVSETLYDNDGAHTFLNMKSIDVDGAFIYVGVEPINALAKQINAELDDSGYIVVDNKLQTSIDGVFAIGDIIHPEMKQIAIAVSDGAIVSKSIKDYVDNQEFL